MAEWVREQGLWLAITATLAGVIFLAMLGLRMMLQWRSQERKALASGMQEAFIWLSPGRLMDLLTWSLLVPGAVLLVVGPWRVMGLFLVIAGLVLPRLWMRWVRQRRNAALRAQLPDAIQLLAGSLRAGLGVPAALSAMASQCSAPISEEFALVVRQQRLGSDLASALDLFDHRVGFDEAAMFSAALRTAASSGGNLADTLERVSSTLRERLVIEGKIDALTAQGRLQGWVVGALPFGLIPVLHALDPDAMTPLWTTLPGLGVMATVTVLVVVGQLWIRKIVSIDV